MNEIPKHLDAIIVGTGPSGALIAKELAKQKKKVLILEKGYTDFSINIPRMIKSKEMLLIGKGRTLVRGVRTGGSSILYYGTAYDPPFEYFLKHGIDLAKEVDELKKELHIAPLKDELIGPAAKKISQSANSLGYRWKKLNKFIDQEMCLPGNFPYEAQWNATRYVNEAIEHGAILLHGADVRRVIIHERQAVGVEYITNGESQKVYASKIILAAGGIGTVPILKASKLDKAGEGFFCDPLVLVQGQVEGIKAGNEITMAMGVEFEEEGFMLSDITLPKLVYQLFAFQAFRFNQMFRHENSLSIMVKIRDRIGGHIDERGKVYKVFTEEDEQKMLAGARIAKEILKQAGAKKIYRTAWTSAHPGGSVRIGDVVDSNLQTEYRSLYVCDCSVIPEEWGLPPTLTLLALAKRMAQHLLDSEGKEGAKSSFDCMDPDFS